jgi:hypothetical protein
LQIVPSGTQSVRYVQVGAAMGDLMLLVDNDHAQQQRLHSVVQAAQFEFAALTTTFGNVVKRGS